MFLRHLRRTTALLHVVDAAAADPATDYYAVREGSMWVGDEGGVPSGGAVDTVPFHNRPRPRLYTRLSGPGL